MNKKLTKAYADKMSAESGHRISQREAEAEIVRIIRHVARTLSHSFKFGYHTAQDIEQQGILYGLEAMNKTEEPRYDPRRPLENFLYVHIHNQLYNYRRKNYIRLETPCSCCDPFNPPLDPCKKWCDWYGRNTAKQNLMRPIDMESVSDEGEARMSNPSTVVQDAITNELEHLIDTRLPVDLRSDYLRMRNHDMVPKARRQRVREAIASIARQAGYLNDEEE